MELALSLGGETQKPVSFLEKSQQITGKDLRFCMSVGGDDDDGRSKKTGSSDPPVQLDLLPFSPVYRTTHPSNKLSFPWLNQILGADLGRGFETNLKRNEADQLLEVASNNSSPNNSTVSSFQMNFSSVFRNGKRDLEKISAANNCNSDFELLGELADHHSRGSDDDEINGSSARKKLRLTKDQSAFLEDSFKEHNTLNPKQKVALAKQLNLRPRQVEVWFQNRRARTKLKQTEVDCEYLKRCCETLTEENKRLQKELSELRALKASHPFYMQLPPTTLTMCPSCERVATTSTTTAAAAASPVTAAIKGSKHFALSPSHAHAHAHAHAQPAS